VCLAYAHGWIPYPFLWPLAGSVALVEGAYVCSRAIKWRCHVGTRDIFRGGAAAALVLLLSGLGLGEWPVRAVNAAAERILPNDETARVYRLSSKLRSATSYTATFVECPGESEVRAWSVETSWGGHAFMGRGGTLAGAGVALLAAAPLTDVSLPPYLSLDLRYSKLYDHFLMEARVYCPMEVKTPTLSVRRLVMPVFVPGASQWDSIRATSQEIPIVLMSSDSARTFRSIASSEERLNEVVVFLFIWVLPLLGGWTAVASAALPKSDFHALFGA